MGCTAAVAVQIKGWHHTSESNERFIYGAIWIILDLYKEQNGFDQAECTRFKSIKWPFTARYSTHFVLCVFSLVSYSQRSYTFDCKHFPIKSVLFQQPNISKTIVVKRQDATLEQNQYIFISHRAVQNVDFLKDDCIFMEVFVHDS